MAENWNCDGSGPHTDGKVKLYPLGGGANLILCHSCWHRENQYRRDRGRETKNPDNWPVLDWASAKPYENE